MLCLTRIAVSHNCVLSLMMFVVYIQRPEIPWHVRRTCWLWFVLPARDCTLVVAKVFVCEHSTNSSSENLPYAIVSSFHYHNIQTLPKRQEHSSRLILLNVSSANSLLPISALERGRADFQPAQPRFGFVPCRPDLTSTPSP